MGKIDLRLERYSAFAAAVTGALASSGQIMYTDVVPDAVLARNGATFELDVNKDGNLDFTFLMYISQSSSTSYRYGYVYGTNGAYVGTYSWSALVMDAGALILSGGSWSDSAYFFSYSYYYSYGTTYAYRYGDWPGNKEKFLPIKIETNSQIHYGWIRLTIPDDCSAIVIHDYAYEATPGKPIKAGEMNNSIYMLEDRLAEKVITEFDEDKGSMSIVIDSKKLTGGVVTVTDQEGKVIRQSKVNRGEDFEFNGLADGYYAILVEFDQGATYYQFQVGEPNDYQYRW